MPQKTALISVSNKNSLLPFARGLTKLKYHLLATGGTYQYLKKNHLAVQEIKTLTNFPEILDGRVKTLHPKIFGGILARALPADQKTLQKYQIPTINLVCVNLYPFSQTIQKKSCTLTAALEQIDIGGVALLRAAAKNFPRVTVVVDPTDYPAILSKLQQNQLPISTRQKLASKALALTAQYDTTISNFLNSKQTQNSQTAPSNPASNLPTTITLSTPTLTTEFQTSLKLRYGENPHQKAHFLKEKNNNCSNIANARVLNGKALSFNNLVDADTAWRLALDFPRPTAAIIKHANPCGVASAPTIEKALTRAFTADTKSPFGGIVALNRPATPAIAAILRPFFLEIIIAPSFSKSALKILQRKKNLRLLATGKGPIEKQEIDLKKIGGGLLIQNYDTRRLTAADCQVVSTKTPTTQQLQDLIFAANVCRQTKSNAIVLAKNELTVGIGAGQTARVDAVEIALAKAGTRASQSVLASDAFFPFADSITVAAHAGLSAILEPGGSIRDPEVIKAADQANLALVFSGVRGFKH